jgi:uncharacterized protein
MIIDCHCHYGKGDGLTGPWDTKANLDKYISWAQKAGINKTVLFSVFHSNYEQANLEVAKIVSTNRNRFYGFAFVNPVKDTGRIFKLIETAVIKYKFCGIKVHRFDGRITREICETARIFNLPVLNDIMGEISVVELLAEEYPDVNFIIPHLGSFADDWKAQTAFCNQLKKYKNIFTDTAGVRRFDLLERAAYEAGPGKILFGTDGPWLHPGVEISKVYALNLDADGTNKILSGNILKLIRNVKSSAQKEDAVNIKTNIISPDNQIKDPWLYTL